MHVDGRRAAVTHGVRQRLGDDEVRRRLHRRRRALVQLDVEPDRERRARDERRERRVEPAVGEDRRVEPAREVAQLGDRALELLVGVTHQHARLLGLRLELLERHAEIHPE